MSQASRTGRQRSRLSVAALLVGVVYCAAFLVLLLLLRRASDLSGFAAIISRETAQTAFVALILLAPLAGVAVLSLAIWGHLRSSISSRVWVWTAVSALLAVACLAVWPWVYVELMRHPFH